MIRKLHIPLFVPTFGVVVGYIVTKEFYITLWTSLALLLVSGVLSIFKGWRVALLLMAVGVGGVRASFDDGESYRSGGQIEHSPIIQRINDSAQDRLTKLQLSPRAETLVSAMVLGDRSGVTSEQRRIYGYSGASHLLAISGLHLSIVVLLLNILLLPLVLLPRGHIVRNVVVIVAMWGYVAIVGFSPSVVRSAMMFSILQMALALGRKYNGLNALLFTILAFTAIIPSILYSVGFQLSVVAVASIFLWGLPLYHRLFGGGGFIISTLCISVACSVATMPIVSHYFGYISLLGMWWNPILVPCAFIIMILGLGWILLPCGLLSPFIWLAIESAAMVQEEGVRWIASQEWGIIMWRVSGWSVGVIYLIYTVVTILIWTSNTRNEEA